MVGEPVDTPPISEAPPHVVLLNQLKAEVDAANPFLEKQRAW